MKRHVVLIGLPGAGKTTVGGLVAERLGIPFVDVDAVIARREGRPVLAIFAEHGEAAFRDMERQEVRRVLGRDPAVLAPGGGWAAQPGAVAEARQHALVVYLRASAETATKRVGPENRATLMSGDPGELMRELLRDREAAYLEAEATIDTEHLELAAVVDAVVRLAQGGAGG